MMSNGCSAQDYMNGDEDLSICQEMDDDSWEETFMSQLGKKKLKRSKMTLKRY